MRENKLREKKMKTKLFFDELMPIVKNLKTINDELGSIIEKLDKTDKDIRYENNKIFLLSIDEYRKYQDVIPECKTCWWLRTPGGNDVYASYVNGDGSGVYYGGGIGYSYSGVRPALKSDIFKKVGKKYVINDFPFTCIDEGLGIATVPITFGKFDDESNDYEESLIKQWLLDWYNESN